MRKDILYLYGVGRQSKTQVRKTRSGYEIAAKRFFLNTKECFYEGDDIPIINAVSDICLDHGVNILHIQDYCGWPYGLIARMESQGVKVIVKIGNAWSLCPRLTLFSLHGKNCSSNFGLDGCSQCVATFRSAGSQSIANNIRAVLRSLRVLSAIQKVYSNYKASQGAPTKQSLGYSFVSRRERYLNDLEKASVVHFSSSMSKDIYMRHGLSGSNARVLNPSIEINERLKEVEPVSPAFRAFGYIGGLSRLKGVDVLVDAFRLLENEGGIVELMIWGDGDRSLVASLPSNIRYMGPYNRSMLPSIMAEIDCGVLPSLCPDVHPIVALEFAAARRPLIMSDSCGTASLPSNIFHELIFQSGSEHDLQARVRFVMNHWKEIYEKSKSIPMPKSMDEVVREYSELYAEQMPCIN